MYPYFQGINLRDGKVISKTVYGEESEIFMADSGLRIRTKVQPRDLQICPDETNYEKDTIESAALNSTYFIQKTNEKIRSIFPDLKISPITLSIAPLVIRSSITTDWSGETTKESMYITDNALYTPGAATITFLPHSKSVKERGFKMNFWEVPMVASHEYGHHIFESIYSGQSSPMGCFGETHKPRTGRKSFDRTVKHEDIMVSYNEGFADLVAFYTLEGKERDVQDVKCLEVSRDVESPVFYNGKPKIFNEEAMRTFFSPYVDYTNGTCEDHSYQDVHVIGAISLTLLTDF